MSRFKYQSYAKDGNGSVITDATISVYLAGGTTAADVYAASSGGSAVASVTSDATTGYFYFWIDDGDYTGEQFFKMIISKAHFGNTTLDEIEVLPLLYAGTGTTAARPTVTTVGMYYVDTDLGHPVFWDGSSWIAFELLSDHSPELYADLDLNEHNIIYDTAGTYVTAVEIGRLDGVTSAIQTQLNTLDTDKAPKADPTFTGEIGIGAVNVSETELGILEGATLSTAELNHVDGVTADIQTQFDNKGIQAWVNFTDATPPVISGSFNVSSVSRTASGDYTVTWDTDFTDTNYVVNITCGARLLGSIHTLTTGTCRINTETTAGGLSDPGSVHVMAIGAQ